MRDHFCHTAAIFHVAAGRDCARAVHAAIIHVVAVHAAIHVVAENNDFNDTRYNRRKQEQIFRLTPKSSD